MFPIIQTVSSKGQLVIPKKMREDLSISAGVKVTLTADKKTNTLTVKPLTQKPAKDLWGVLKADKGDMKRLLTQKYEEIARGE